MGCRVRKYLRIRIVAVIGIGEEKNMRMICGQIFFLNKVFSVRLKVLPCFLFSDK